MPKVVDPEPRHSAGRRMAFLGRKEEILPFKALGIDAYSLESSEKEELISHLREKDYSIILLSEAVYEDFKEFTDEEVTKFTPAVVIIPGPEGSRGLGEGRVKKMVEKAVGVDLLGEKRS